MSRKNTVSHRFDLKVHEALYFIEMIEDDIEYNEYDEKSGEMPNALLRRLNNFVDENQGTRPNFRFTKNQALYVIGLAEFDLDIVELTAEERRLANRVVDKLSSFVDAGAW